VSRDSSNSDNDDGDDDVSKHENRGAVGVKSDIGG